MTSFSELPSDPHPLAGDDALRRRLIALARHWLALGDDAEDLVQEAWLRTAQGMPALSPEGREAWLVTVLRHLCIDAWRRQRLHQAGLAQLAGEDVPPAHPADLAEQAERVEQALRHVVRVLPAGDVAAVLLHEVFGFGHAELGPLSGRSEAASRQQLHRALQRLRRSAPARGPEDDDAACLFALCQLALARRDPAGLVAVLRTATPQAMALFAQAPSPRSSRPAQAPRAYWVRFGNLLALLTYSDGVVACLTLDEPSSEALAD
ncbi:MULTISPECIES: RNA polymerase sigma factor [Comamonadaceae]|uniref:RNA polymerase sigma factor n=1 Tax=Acidovorax sacchari TaxID=3230736 RepID=UPI0034A3E829